MKPGKTKSAVRSYFGLIPDKDAWVSLLITSVNDAWEIHSKCLQILYLPESHTGENLSEGLCDILKS